MPFFSFQLHKNMHRLLSLIEIICYQATTKYLYSEILIKRSKRSKFQSSSRVVIWMRRNWFLLCIRVTFIRDIDREQFDCHGHCWCTHSTYCYFFLIFCKCFAIIIFISIGYLFPTILFTFYTYMYIIIYLYEKKRLNKKKRTRNILHTSFLVCEYVHTSGTTTNSGTAVINA